MWELARIVSSSWSCRPSTMRANFNFVGGSKSLSSLGDAGDINIGDESNMSVEKSAENIAPKKRIANKRYLNVDYKDKETVKELGGKWDPRERKWFIPLFSKEMELEKFRKWSSPSAGKMTAGRVPYIYLNVPYTEKDFAKFSGARYDGKVKRWFIPKELDSKLESFRQWIPKDFNMLRADWNSSTRNVLILDLETSGLPTPTGIYDRYHDITDSSKYDSSRIVQISCMLCDRSTLTNQLEFDAIIRADDFDISAESTAIHGITTQRSHDEGFAFRDVVTRHIAPLLKQAHIVAAHNANFDVHVLQAELYRYGLVEALSDLNALEVYCTMHKTKRLVGALGKNGKIKNPSLKELFEFAVKESITNQHNSRFDVMNLHAAMRALSHSGLLAI